MGLAEPVCSREEIAEGLSILCGKSWVQRLSAHLYMLEIMSATNVNSMMHLFLFCFFPIDDRVQQIVLL